MQKVMHNKTTTCTAKCYLKDTRPFVGIWYLRVDNSPNRMSHLSTSDFDTVNVTDGLQ